MPVLEKLQSKYDFNFIVIADKDPKLPLKAYQFILWRRETEIRDLLSFHIGLMPLTDDEVSRGKCGFKAIQYMSLGIPAVVSNVGVNASIVENGVNGFVCKDLFEWEKALASLLMDSSLRKQFGESAKRRIDAKYSVVSTATSFLGQFNNNS
jgi:glycosyltransferase involved in cell wall biosynthesis